jgi:hypothetical protein
VYADQYPEEEEERPQLVAPSVFANTGGVQAEHDRAQEKSVYPSPYVTAAPKTQTPATSGTLGAEAALEKTNIVYNAVHAFDKWIVGQSTAMYDAIHTKEEAGQSPLSATLTTAVPRTLKFAADVFGEIMSGFARRVKRAGGYLVYLNEAAPLEGSQYSSQTMLPVGWEGLLIDQWIQDNDTENLNKWPELVAERKKYQARRVEKIAEFEAAGQTPAAARASAELSLVREEWSKQGIVRSVGLVSAAAKAGKEGVSLESVLDEKQAQAWVKSAGWGYTHMLDPNRKQKYDQLVADGVDPVEAGNRTKNWLVEMAWEQTIDPMAWVGLQGAAFGVLKQGVADTGKLVYKMTHWIPGWGGALDWLGSVSARTVANHAARSARDISKMLSKYTDNVEELAGWVESPESWEGAAHLTGYYRRALAETSNWLSEHPEDAEKLLHSAGKKAFDAWQTQLEEVIYKQTLEAQLESSPLLYKSYLQWKKGSVARGLSTVNGYLVDTWLGLRPSWNVFNYIDNALKVAIDGVSPWTDLGTLLKRYRVYSTMPDDELEELVAKRNAFRTWDLRTALAKGGEHEIDALGEGLPTEVVGELGGVPGIRGDAGGIVAWAKGGKSSIPGLKQVKELVGGFAEQNLTFGQRIERTMRSRLYLSKFFDAVDSAWEDVVTAPIQYKRGEQLLDVADDVAGSIRADLKRMTSPTTEQVQALARKYLAKDTLDVVQLGSDPGFPVQSLDPRIVKNVQASLGDLAESGSTTTDDIVDVFTRAEKALKGLENQSIAATRSAFTATLPELSIDANEIYETLLPAGRPVTVSSLGQAVDNLPLFQHRVALESEKMIKEFADEYSNMLEEATRAGRGMDEVYEYANQFWTVRRVGIWKDYSKAQGEVLERIAAQAEEVTGETFPREAIKQYMDAVDNINDLFSKEADMWGVSATAWRGPHGNQFKSQVVGTTNYAVDKMWRSAGPANQDAKAQALAVIKKWFTEHGLDADANTEGMADFAQNAEQWVIGTRLRKSLDAVSTQFSDMLDELTSWKQHALTQQIRPTKVVHISSADRAGLEEFFAGVTKKVDALVSGAQESAIAEVNRVLFDYSTTENWMSLMSNVMPFTRWPAKNIPLWLDVFTEKPWLYTGATRLRQAQAMINRDLPTRLQLTVPISPKLPDTAFWQALGLGNTQLRVNPWSFVSIFQQMPGGTPFKAEQIADMFDEAEYGGDPELKSATNMLYTMAQQVGFGMWPYWEYPLGMFGFLGKDWYPRDVMGSWSPLVNWASNEVFGNPNLFDVDRFVRSKLPEYWNVAFGNTPLAWAELNPDLMIDWLRGREIEGLVMKLPENEQQQVAAMSAEEQQAWFKEKEKIALRQALRKKMVTTLSGTVSGLYLQAVDETEVVARLEREQKRMRQEAIGPGPDYREFERVWREEHPSYGLIQRWRFGEYPWATTQSEKEAERWDTLVDDYTSQWWDYNDQWNTTFETRIEETVREYPGDKQRLKLLKSELYSQRDTKLKQLNAELKTELEGRMRQYIAANPTDKKGIELLRNGWEIPVYRTLHLTEEERAKVGLEKVPVEEMADLREGRASTPEAQARMRAAYDAVRAEKSMNEMRRVPGLESEGGITIDLSSSENSRTQDEIWELRVGGVLRKLADGAPAYEEFETSKEWWTAYQDYLSTLENHALELPEVQEQIRVFQTQQHVTKEEATEVVRGWYKQEELQRYWRKNDSIWEALEEAYQTSYVAPADEIYRSEVSPAQDTDYVEYNALKSMFFDKFGAIPATDMIPYIMSMYSERFASGEWNQKMLEDAFQGIELPGIQDRWRLRSTGRSALQSYIYHYYDMLDANAKRDAQQAFGTVFSETFLEGNSKALSVELLGSWVTALAGMVGEAVDWHDIPGVDAESLKEGGLKKMADYGLPYVGPPDMEEFAQAKEINSKYWELRAAGDEAYKELEDDPLRTKWFASVPQSLFWDFYYNHVPPGAVSKQLRENPLVALILDEPIRVATATSRDYERALTLMESWSELNSEMLYDYPVEEWEQVRQEMSEYFSIPTEDKAAQKEYRKNHALLVKYLTSPKSSDTETSAGAGTSKKSSGGGGGGGGQGRSSGSAELRAVWASFKGRAGASFSSAYLFLYRLWTGTASAEELAYLHQLHNQLGGGISFEEWTDKLRQAAVLYGTSSQKSASVSQPEAPPKVTYYGGATGYRRIR